MPAPSPDHGTRARWRHLTRSVLPLVLAASSAMSQAPQGAGSRAGTAQGGPIAFVNVTVIPMDRERTIPGQTVIVQNGRITSMGEAAAMRLAATVQQVDGSGKFLVPGFTEMHGHLPFQNGPFAESVMALYTLAGVTTVRGMLGHPVQLEMRRAINRGAALGPTLYLAGPALGGGNIWTPAEGRVQVREQKASGYDLLKIQEGLAPNVYDTIAATAKAVGIPFSGHVPNAVGVKRALEAGQRTIEHLDNYVEALETTEFAGSSEDEKISAMVALTKRTGSGVVPTMALWEVILGQKDPADMQSRAELRYMPPAMVQGWTGQVNQIRQQQQNQANGPRILEQRKKLLRAMRDGGVPILFGTDAPQLFSVPGFSVWREIEVMKDAGLTNYEILRSGTRAVAEYMNAANQFGSIAVGRRADLVLLDANPLEDIKNFQRQSGVMVRGRWMPKEEIDRRLADIAKQYGR